jgi:hypothetical protein
MEPATELLSSLGCKEFPQRPNTFGNTCFHSWSTADRGVDSAEVVVGKMQSVSGF